MKKIYFLSVVIFCDLKNVYSVKNDEVLLIRICYCVSTFYLENFSQHQISFIHVLF